MPHHEYDAALEINSTDCPTKIVGVSFYRCLLQGNAKFVCFMNRCCITIASMLKETSIYTSKIG